MESMPKQDLLTRLQLDLRRHGRRRTAYVLAMKLINKLFLFRVLHGLHLQRVNPAYLDCPEGFVCGFLGEAQLRRYARDPRNELDDDFLDEALAKGDRCYGILRNGQLAAYGWYSLQPTRIHPPELLLEFGPGQVYAYKSLTLPEYRGRRLNAVGTNRALQCYQRLGTQGLVCYVDSHNMDSLKACHRLGFRRFGSIWLLRLLGRYAVFNSPGCARFDFRLKEAPPCLDALGVNEA